MAAVVAGAVLLTGGQALALGCLDMPGAKLDPALDASAANQSYGRLFPEFKSQKKTEQVIRKLPIDRLVGRRLQLEGGAGQVWLALTQDGTTEITALTTDTVAKHTVPTTLVGLDNTAYNGKLARTFFSHGIAWKDFAAPLVPAIDFAELPAAPTIAGISRTNLQLKGAPKVNRSQTIEYACSSDAAYVGDPAKLSTVVVLKGTIRATQLTTTTTTNTVLDLTINDVVEQQTVSYSDLVALLGGYPEIAPVLKEMRTAGLAQTAQATPAPPAKEPGTAETLAAAPTIQTTPPAPTHPGPAPTDPEPQGGINWAAILAALAALCAIVLGVLFHPRFTARRQRDNIAFGPLAARLAEARAAVRGSEDAGEPTVSRPESKLTDAISASDPVADGTSSTPHPQALGPDAPGPDAQEAAGAGEPAPVEPESIPAEAEAGPRPKVAAMVVEPAPKVVSQAPEPEAEPEPNPVAEPRPEVGTAPESQSAPQAEPEPEPAKAIEPEAQPIAVDPHAEDSDTDQQDTAEQDTLAQDRDLEARIAALETMRIDTQAVQEKLKQAIEEAASEAESARIARQKLAAVESRLAELTESRTQALEAAQDDRAKLNAVRDEALGLKEQVIDLKTRLARANAQIESSMSIVSELESASRMAIELNADYRTKTNDASAENRAMRSRVGLLESALAERDELLQSTNQINEEISRTLLQERAERASLQDDFNALSRDHETLQQTTGTRLKQTGMEASQTAQELEAAREQIASFEAELERAVSENKHMQLDHHARQTENARLRVDYGVRTKLLENNLQELSAHIEVLEQRLQEAGMPVPALQLTPIEKSAIDAEQPPASNQPPQHNQPPVAEPTRKRGDILRFRAKR